MPLILVKAFAAQYKMEEDVEMEFTLHLYLFIKSTISVLIGTCVGGMKEQFHQTFCWGGKSDVCELYQLHVQNCDFFCKTKFS